MAFSDQVTIIGRQPINQVVLTLDACDNVYGESPCTATDAIENLIDRSEEFDNATWTKVLMSVTPNIANAPQPSGGVNEADRLIPTSGSGNHQISNGYVPLATEDEFTIAAYIALDNLATPALRYHIVDLLYNDATVGAIGQLIFDLDTRVMRLVDGPTGTVLDFGVAEVRPGVAGLGTFYRLWMAVRRSSSGTTTQNLFLRLIDPANDINDAPSTSYVGNDVDGLLCWGAQLRRGLNPGKYIQTIGTVVTAPDGKNAHNLCYNTFATCQDTPNYVKTAKVITFIDAVAQPFSVVGYPVIKNISYAGTKIDPGRGLGARAKVTITLQDFPHNDFDFIDEYAQIRALPLLDTTTRAEINQENFGTL